MQLIHPKTALSRIEVLARFLHTALVRYPALFGSADAVRERLAALATRLEASLAALLAVDASYRDAVRATTAPRLELKLVDLKTDELVRSIKRAADEAGPDVSAAVFPSGITPIIKPIGATELRELEHLAARIAATSRWVDRESHHARVIAAHGEYAAALEGRAAASRAAAAARYVRDDAKHDFANLYASIAGAIKELFPRDRARQDVFFDAIAPGSGKDKEEEPAPPAA